MKFYQGFNFAEYLYSYAKTVIWYKLFLKKCGKKCVIYKPIFLSPEYMCLGNNVYIRNNARIECVIIGDDINIIIQDHVNIEQNVHMTCGNRIFIGKNTAIAANVSITDIKHTYEDVGISPKIQPLKASEVIIEQDCTIYNNSVILPGTILGKHSIVAANSVVIGKKYPEYSVLAGNPAVIVKRYSFEKNMWLKTNEKGDFIN